MIAFVYGTTAELIKIAPVYNRLVDLGARPLLWSTGQHVVELPETARRLGLPGPDLELGRGRSGRNLARIYDVIPWAMGVASVVVRRRRSLVDQLWSDDRPPLILVHGDTMTTVMGAAIGRWYGVTVGHIEAGLRTNKLFEPFPEELDRRIAGRLAQVHFTPGLDKFGNLARTRGIKVDTIANTVLDSVRSAPDVPQRAVPDLVQPYGIVSLHRFELIQQGERFEEILTSIALWSKVHEMVVVTDAQTALQITRLGLDHLLDRPGIRRVDKLTYFDFIALLRAARFVVTDSGGLQEECAYLNVPCLVHRTTTERTDGLGANVVLSMFDVDVVGRFLADPDRYRMTNPPELPSPSQIIVDHLVESGHAAASSSSDRRELDVSVLVPTRQDADTIRAALQTLVRTLDGTSLDYEVLVISDGSRDNTVWQAEQVESPRIRVLHYTSDSGRGFAVKFGYAQTRGRIVITADPSILHDPTNVLRVLDELERSGADVVAASKTAPGSDASMSRLRALQTRVFSTFVSRTLDVPVSDAQLGLKAFRRPVLDELLPHIRSAGFAFDIELLAAASHSGYVIVETPVVIPGRLHTIADPFWIARALAGCARLAVLRYQIRPRHRTRVAARTDG